MRDFSIIKQRILQYLDNKGISKYECYQKTGITNGVFSQKSGISEDNLLSFLSYYTDINYTWLLTGRGEMLRNSNDVGTNVQQAEPTIIYRDNPDKDEIIKLQRRQIELLEQNARQSSPQLGFYAPGQSSVSPAAEDPAMTAILKPKKSPNEEKNA